MTREEIAEIIYGYANYKNTDTSADCDLSKYVDVHEISENAVAAMKYVIQNGIMNGKTEHTIDPGDNTTRAEIAVILERFENVTNKGE